jgi:hypothetical protein
MLTLQIGETKKELSKLARYGSLPEDLGVYQVKGAEMMFTQYLPIKLTESIRIAYEPRFRPYKHIIDIACTDFIREFGYDKYRESYVYLTVKNMYQLPEGNSFNREGYHSDGFLTNDINYIWSDKFPTVFNTSDFKLSLNDRLSLREMKEQAKAWYNKIYTEGSLLKLDQYCIHKVGEVTHLSMRNFVKVSISRDKYNLEGNSHNYLLDYDWVMKKR